MLRETILAKCDVGAPLIVEEAKVFQGLGLTGASLRRLAPLEEGNPKGKFEEKVDGLCLWLEL